MNSPLSPMTPSSCQFFETYGLESSPYVAYTPDAQREICIRKCSSVAPILKDNWMDLIFKVNFPNLISQEKLVHGFSLQELTDILAQADLLPEEREEIKKIRCKARNNKAAKSLRLKYKEQDQSLFNDVRSLKKHKDELIKEIDEIRQEISEYKSMGVGRN